MRLVHTTTIQLEEFAENAIPPYAILSHRWEDGEVTFQDMSNNVNKRTKGYRKIQRFCQRAAQDQLEYAWVDTCCINKESSAELSEAINSMFRWYQMAEVCYAFLSDVHPDDQEKLHTNVKQSQWFTRGWTLQELIAPSKLVFLATYDWAGSWDRNGAWKDIGSRDDLSTLIREVTAIDESILQGKSQLHEFSIAKRMSWAAGRKTTRTEDVAYCLMGVFNINMPLLYGEGENAFIRLQEEIMKDSDDQSLFAWEHLEEDDDCPIGLLAKSPLDFKNSGSIIPFYFVKDRMPYAVTNRGIRLHLPLFGSSPRSHLILECQDTSVSYSRLVGINVIQIPGHDNQYIRARNRGMEKKFTFLDGLDRPKTIYVEKAFTTKKNSDARTVGCSLFDQSPYDFPSKSARHAADDGELHPKNLVICFQEPRNVTKNSKSLSNVERIYKLLDCTNASQLHYAPVVPGKHFDDVVECVNDAYAWLVEHYKPHDRIYVFGLSIGGYAAQDLARMLENIGLLPRNFNEHVEVSSAFHKYRLWNSATLGNEYYEMDERTRYWDMREFREKYCRPVDKVTFLGLFDTVNPDTESDYTTYWPLNLLSSRPVDRVTFFGLFEVDNPNIEDEDTTYWPLDLPSRFSCSGCIVRHAVSVDERKTRPPALAVSDVRTGYTQDIQELWFSGYHADICGTAPVKPGDELGPGHIPLAWMIREAANAGLRIDKRKFMHEFRLDTHERLQSLDIDSILASDELISAIWIASTEGHRDSTTGSEESLSLQCVIKNAFERWNCFYPSSRTLPSPAQIHGSVVERMKATTYRPKNLSKGSISYEDYSKNDLNKQRYSIKLRGYLDCLWVWVLKWILFRELFIMSLGRRNKRKTFIQKTD